MLNSLFEKIYVTTIAPNEERRKNVSKMLDGVQSFYTNLLNYLPAEAFDKKFILIDHPFNNNPKPKNGFQTGNEEVFEIKPYEHIYKIAERLERKVSNKPGVVLVNFETEMATMDLCRKNNKVLVAVCHDAYFLPFLEKYAFLLDAFVAHNPFFMRKLKKFYPSEQVIFTICHIVSSCQK